MATRESNVIMFPQPIDPEHKEDRIAEQFFVKVDGLVMKGLRRDLAAADACSRTKPGCGVSRGGAHLYLASNTLKGPAILQNGKSFGYFIDR